jgi:hypothetical protein
MDKLIDTVTSLLNVGTPQEAGAPVVQAVAKSA